MTAAITIVKDEHRALAAVLDGLPYLIDPVRNTGQTPGFGLMKSMLAYIVAFPAAAACRLDAGVNLMSAPLGLGAQRH